MHSRRFVPSQNPAVPAEAPKRAARKAPPAAPAARTARRGGGSGERKGGGDGAKAGPSRARGKGAVVFGLAVAVMIILVSVGLYNFAIPRTEMRMTTVYHEAAAGGLSPIINVNVKIANTGTRELVSVTLNATVAGPGGRVMAQGGLPGSSISLKRGDEYELPMQFFGSQLDEYSITIKVSYTSGGITSSKTVVERTSEPAMNLEFERTFH